ncbi:hypothetical protein [Halosimplex halobium]|uniref:hypothetical protein n=1 Tax=Halosimplex halobium TaxID=3396618 RepID=UPI003F576DB4
MSDKSKTAEVETNESESEVNEEAESEQEDDERDIVNPEDFSTLKLTLEEARRQYDDEERRRTAVENKIGIVVTVDTLLISFAALFSQDLHLILLVTVMVPALASAGLGLYAIRSRDYERPGKDIWDFHDYSGFDDEDTQREQLLLDYETTTGGNQEKNDPKFTYFNWCIALTFTSLVLVLLTPIAQHFGIDVWLIEQGKNVASYLPV